MDVHGADLDNIRDEKEHSKIVCKSDRVRAGGERVRACESVRESRQAFWEITLILPIFPDSHVVPFFRIPLLLYSIGGV